MKAFERIQIVASAIGLSVAMRCADNLTPTGNELLAGCTLAIVSIVGFVGLYLNKKVKE